MSDSKYPTAIIHCPDCGIECNFVANNFYEMPVSYPGTYHPHQRGSRLCLERQVSKRQNEIKQLSETIDAIKSSYPNVQQYRLYWKMKHPSIIRTVGSEILEDLAIVYNGLVTIQRVEMETLELKKWDEAAAQYKSIPFPANWKEIIKKAMYGGAKYLKCPICGNVDKIPEENILGTCELCYAHGGTAPQMEPFEG